MTTRPTAFHTRVTLRRGQSADVPVTAPMRLRIRRVVVPPHLAESVRLVFPEDWIAPGDTAYVRVTRTRGAARRIPIGIVADMDHGR